MKLRTSILLWAAVVGVGQVAAGTAAEADAIGVVESYLGALMVGDVDRVKASLGSALADERGALLDNPGYPGSLQKAYAGADYRITDSRQLSGNRAEVDALLMLADDQSVAVRFELEARDQVWRIVAER
jgi:hypothetical protein